MATKSLLRGALIALLLCAGAALTKPAAAQDEKTKIATEKFKEGVKALEAQQYQAARAAFLEVYAIKHAPGVLLNLGLSELKSGFVEDGANHLQQFLREYDKANDAQKKTAKDSIAEAKARTGFVVITVDTDGVPVGVDGQPVGTSPLIDPVFVKPGQHEAEAGATTVARAKFVARPFTGGAIKLSLKAAAAGAPAPGAAVASTAPAAAAGGDDSSATWKNDLPEADQPKKPGAERPEPQAPKGFGGWVKTHKASWALIVGAGVGLGMAIGGGAAAGVANSNASSLSNQILGEVNSGRAGSQLGSNYRTASGQPIPCGGPSGNPPPAPHYATACNSLSGDISARGIDLGVMGAGIALAVLAGGGFAAYYFVDTKKKPAAAEAPPAARLTVAPILTPMEQGLGLMGSF